MFAYTASELDKLEFLLSSDRLQSYGPTRPVSRATIDLYVWNTALAAAFYGPLQALEVSLRNALHRELTSLCGREDWYRSQRFRRCAYDVTGSLAELGNRLTRDGKPVGPSNVVAGLHLGFWTKLVNVGPNGNRVRLLWNAGLHCAFAQFPGGAHGNRGPIYAELLRMKDFRNRIAHHEPIHNKNPRAELQRILSVAGWIDADLPRWISYHARCDLLLEQMPLPRQLF